MGQYSNRHFSSLFLHLISCSDTNSHRHNDLHIVSGVDMQDKLHNQPKESDLWLLIQYERPPDMIIYDIIHSSRVVQKVGKMDSGASIDVRYGNSVMKAVISTISGEFAYARNTP